MPKSDSQPPLFVELSEEHQREDALSGPHGFVFGGMFLPNKLDMAEQYLHAANVLVDTIRCQKEEDFRLANPVLFLYRHAIELLLKGMLGSGSTHHKIDVLGADLKVLIRNRYQENMPAWIIDRLNELAAIDPNSMAFRYAEDKYRGSKQLTPVEGEVYVGAKHLQETMNALFSALLGAARKMEAKPAS